MAKIYIFLFVFLWIFQFSAGQDGDVDTSFADNGLQKFAIPDKNTRPNTLITLDNGAFFLGGSSDIIQHSALSERGLFVVKYLPDGTPDSTFADNGIFQVPNNGDDPSWLSEMLKQPDGKLLIVGEVEGTPMLLRIDQQGNYDQSFSNNGQAPIQDGSHLGLQSDGKIVVVGQHFDGYNNNYLLSRYLPNGDLDLTFGNDGSNEINITTSRFDICLALQIFPDDKIILAGKSYTQHNHAILSKYDSNGHLDSGFGQNGIVVTDLGEAPGHGYFFDVEILPNGKILAGGNKTYSGGTGGFGGLKPALARYNSDGTLDNSFGENGRVILNTIFQANDMLYSIKAQSDHKILFIGAAGMPFPYMQTYFYLSRLNSDGSLDYDFAHNGKFLNDFSAQTNDGRGIALLEDGKIIAFGERKNLNTKKFETLILRFTNKSLGHPANSMAPGIVVYPNPTTSKLHIVSKNHSSKLDLYNSRGQQVLSADNDTKTIDLSNFASGIYFLKMEFNDNQTITKKVIKK